MDTKQIQMMAVEIYRVQSKGLVFAVPMTEKRRKCAVSHFHGENRGSIPLGRANKDNSLVLIEIFGVLFVSGRRVNRTALWHGPADLARPRHAGAA
jgi:hypothetical protein